MNKKIKKNSIMICAIMIFIHILGLVYQILSNAPTLSILLKELFIVIFVAQIILIKFEFKYTKYICYGLNLAIIVISAIYMDFSSVIISILLTLYISTLNSNFTYIENIENNKSNTNIKTKKQNTKTANKKSTKKDVR